MIKTTKSCPPQFACMAADSSCPEISDPCMNDDNYAECEALVDSGCEEILQLESCPLQFGCAGASGRTERFLAEDDPGACVTLNVFSNKKCIGEPIREL